MLNLLILLIIVIMIFQFKYSSKITLVMILHTSVRYIKEQRNRTKRQTNRTITRRLYSPFKSSPFSVPGIYFLLKRDSGIRGSETDAEGCAASRHRDGHRARIPASPSLVFPEITWLAPFAAPFARVPWRLPSREKDYRKHYPGMERVELGKRGHNLGINSVRIIGSFNWLVICCTSMSTAIWLQKDA